MVLGPTGLAFQLVPANVTHAVFLDLQFETPLRAFPVLHHFQQLLAAVDRAIQQLLPDLERCHLSVPDSPDRQFGSLLVQNSEPPDQPRLLDLRLLNTARELDHVRFVARLDRPVVLGPESREQLAVVFLLADDRFNLGVQFQVLQHDQHVAGLDLLAALDLHGNHLAVVGREDILLGNRHQLPGRLDPVIPRYQGQHQPGHDDGTHHQPGLQPVATLEPRQ